MQEFKIISTNKMVLDKVAHDFGMILEYLGEDVGKGYVADGEYLRVFVEGSEVDQSNNFSDITSQYLQTSTLLGGMGVL